MLLAYSQRQALEFWQAFGRCFQGVLQIRRGHLSEGLASLAAAIDGLRVIRFGVYYNVFLSEYAEALARAGRAGGRRTIDEALDRADRNAEHWYKPELLRIKGEIVLREALPGAGEEAERCFVESLDLSARQETTAWRLRAATSLAQLHLRQNQAAKAHDVLAPVYAGFSEGFETADMKAAKELLAQFPKRAKPRR